MPTISGMSANNFCVRRNHLPLLALMAFALGCGSHRDLIGNWTAVNTEVAPSALVRMTFIDPTHLKLSTGEICRYEATDTNTVRITYPSGETFSYGFTRSGENLTLVDNGRKIPYTLDQS